jgi:pimeloyl-ACP methyl ester carboxylesterase
MPAQRELWSWDPLYSINASRYGVPFAVTHSKVTNAIAAALDARKEGGGVLSHINTPNTARDMLSIVRAHGREKIQYYGFSYGTVLGATFASMFPVSNESCLAICADIYQDKIERLILDGVSFAEDHYSGW